MSPEQAMGHEVDGKADVFSFGVVLYEMATGFSPFLGPTPQATLARLLNQAPKPVNELNPTTPPMLEQLINRCLEKDPTRRPTAKEVTLELKRIQASLSAKDLAPVAMPQSQSGSFAGGFQSGSGSSMRQSVSVVPVSSSKLPSPGSAVTAPAEPITPEQAKQYQMQYTGVKALRWVMSIWTLTIPLSFFFKFLVVGQLIKPALVEGTKLLGYVDFIVGPAQGAANNILNFNTKVNNWDFLLIGLGIAGFAVRHLVMLPVDKLEHWAKTRVVRAKQTGTKGAPVGSVQERVSNQRLAMLREYSEAQRVLQQGRRHLAFLSVDIVGSTKMKVGEDKLVIEHAFAEYKKFVERILKGNNVWKVTWTPDGIMCAFPTAEEAAKAGQTILSELEWFNDGVHRLRTPFSVRCGINTGEVIFPDDKAMEDISDENIDVAGHMQKYAAPNTLWLGKEVLSELESSAGFEQITTQMVDGRVPYEWKLRATAKAGGAD
jgi:class 3 adenylate cyclase